MKTITTVLIGLVVFLFLLNLSGKRQRDNYIDQITELTNSNRELRENISVRDREIENKKNMVAILQDSIKIVREQLSKKQAEFAHLDAIYGTLQEETNMPPDESYALLNDEIYPFSGDKVYPFNIQQVQNIHLTFLQWRQRGYMIDNLQGQVGYYEKEVGLCSSVNRELKGTISIMQENRSDMETMIVNKDMLIQTHRQEVVKQRRQKTLWQVATGLAVGAAIIL
jgi:hypothetical protein